MRTTLNLDDALIRKAQKATGLTEKTRLLHLGLEALVQQKAAEALAELGGSDPLAFAAPRRKATGEK